MFSSEAIDNGLINFRDHDASRVVVWMGDAMLAVAKDVIAARNIGTDQRFTYCLPTVAVGKIAGRARPEVPCSSRYLT
jgi:hypothetical protein